MDFNMQLKKTFKKLGLVTGLVSVLLIPGNSFAQDTIVINTNGSFESADTTAQADTAAVAGWTFELQDGAAAGFAIIDSVVKDGSRALAISVSTTGPNEWSIQAINEPFDVVAGDTYTLSLWAKASATGTTANFTIGNPSFAEFGRIGNANVALTEDWQLFSTSFVIPAGNTQGRAPLHFNFAGNVGNTIYIDSVTISKPAPAPGSQYDPIAKGKQKWLGNVYSQDQLPLFLNYWNQVTPENAGKWGSVEGTRDNMNWTQLDAAYNLAKNNGLPFRFHVLVWGGQQPGWINSLPPAEQLEEIEEWFTEVAQRYPDIDYLEVVNEPLHQRPDGVTGDADYWEALGAQGETGWDWVIKAFEMARAIFPEGTRLIINDYGIISSQNAVNQYKVIIELLKERGLIDGIGVQSHAFNNGSSLASGTTPGTIRNSLNSLAELNLPIQATEFDIDGNPNLSDSDSEEVQLENYKRIFPVFWEHPAVEGVTLWGWRPGMWRSDQDAFIFDQRPKDAMDWLEDYVDTANVIFDVSIEDGLEAELPAKFSLAQNYPNPFNPSTVISYQLAVNSVVSLKVYDMLGREVAILVNGMQTAGSHQVTFNAAGLSSGIYLYRLYTGQHSVTRKMMLLK